MSDIERLIQQLAKLPGLGPRSARRAALHMLKRRETLMQPLVQAMTAAAEHVLVCAECGNLDTKSPCAICTDPARDPALVCVIEDVSDLWALERTGFFKGRYHVLGGTLSALDGVGPDELRIPQLIARVHSSHVREVILALSFTVDGQTTAHYIADRLAGTGVSVTGIAHGVPLGGELDYMDEATLVTALKARRDLG
ncbi:MAG: recombination mediator RecR [Defluviicoccus sp.]